MLQPNALHTLTIQNVGLNMSKTNLLELFADYNPANCHVHPPQAGGVTVADFVFRSFDQAKLCQREKKGWRLPNGQVVAFSSTIKRVEDTAYSQSQEKFNVPIAGDASSCLLPPVPSPPKVRNLLMPIVPT